MDTSTPRAAVAALALLTVALAGCGDDGDGGGGGGGGDTDAAPLGTSVEIDFYAIDGTDNVQGPGTVTITDVREGATKDLTDAGFTLDPDEAAATPFYVDIAFQSKADAPVDLRSPSGRDQDGNLINSLTLISLSDGPAFAPCPDLPDTLAAGEAAKGCAIILVPEGAELEQVSYLPGAGAEFLYWESGL